MTTKEDSMIVQAEHDDTAKKHAKKWLETEKGKGRVVQRVVGGGSTSASGVQHIPALSNIDLEHGEKPNDPKPRFDGRFDTKWIAYYTLDSPQTMYAALGTMWASCPLLLKKSPFLVNKGGVSFGVLGTCAGQGKVKLLCSDAKKHRFFEFDESKNDASGPYYVREYENRVVEMSMMEFVECSKSWTKQKLLLQAELYRYYTRKNDSETEESFCQQAVSGPLAGIASMLNEYVDWDWMYSVLKSQRFYNIRRVYLEAGVRGGLQPAKYSTSDELLIQLCGRRRVVLVAPSDAFEGVYPFPTSHTYDKFAMVDLERMDEARWPGLNSVCLHRAVLEPGEMLYIPAYWFAHIHDLEEENASLRVSLLPHERVPAKDATLLRISRAIEERVADVVGESEVKRWLRIMASGQEVRHLDLGTVQGYKRARMCQDVREEIENSLGEGSWMSNLSKIYTRRLEPTPWLNQNFREPLLITDTPRRIEDTRTEEERKYPTLFRSKLQQEGWNVEPTVSTVPIPGVNMPKDADYRMM